MTEVRLTKAETFELDPAKSYLIQIEKDTLREEDVLTLRKTFQEWGIKNAVFVFVPKGKSLKVIETKKGK